MFLSLFRTSAEVHKERALVHASMSDANRAFWITRKAVERSPGRSVSVEPHPLTISSSVAAMSTAVVMTKQNHSRETRLRTVYFTRVCCGCFTPVNSVGQILHRMHLT